MKKNVVKMRVCTGFDCNPRLDAISYEDEMAEDGRIYQSTRGIRNEKTLVDFNQIWVKFDNSSKTPFWDAYVIVDAGISKDDYNAICRKLYEAAFQAVRDCVGEFTARVNALAVPDNPYGIVSECLNPSSSSSENGRVLMRIDEFKKVIRGMVKDNGEAVARNAGKDSSKWKDFIDSTLTVDDMDALIRGLPVLKISGDSVSFQTRELYDQAVAAISGKVIGDIFVKFVDVVK